MDGYLLDNNAIAHWFSKQKDFCGHMSTLGDDPPLFVSAIIVGEIECGHKTTLSTDPDRREEYEKFVRERLFSYVLPIGVHTREPYAYLRSNLFWMCIGKKKKKMPKHPELWEDPLTGHALGIDENDLWTAASAIEHNLVLVTNDKLRQLREADKEGRLLIEDWVKPAPTAST